jgi:hypothetical protein
VREEKGRKKKEKKGEKKKKKKKKRSEHWRKLEERKKEKKKKKKKGKKPNPLCSTRPTKPKPRRIGLTFPGSGLDIPNLQGAGRVKKMDNRPILTRAHTHTFFFLTCAHKKEERGFELVTSVLLGMIPTD